MTSETERLIGDAENDLENRARRRPGWEDPECPKCGRRMGDRMMVVCVEYSCPAGLK